MRVTIYLPPKVHEKLMVDRSKFEGRSGITVSLSSYLTKLISEHVEDD